jgi:proline iminopeptidase
MSTERYISNGSAKLWTVSTGRGAPLLLITGGPGCDDYLEPVAKLVHERCQVIRFEPRGCGRSVWDGQYGVRTLIEDIEAIRRAYGIERWIVAGHSHGPNIALAYALAYQEHVIGVIGIADGKFVKDIGWHATYKTRLEKEGEDVGGKVFIADPMVNAQGNADWSAYCERSTVWRDLADLETPCVFINAAEDIRPNWPTRQLAALVRRGRYVEIEGARHTIWLTHAGELKSELEKAIDELLAK